MNDAERKVGRFRLDIDISFRIDPWHGPVAHPVTVRGQQSRCELPLPNCAVQCSLLGEEEKLIVPFYDSAQMLLPFGPLRSVTGGGENTAIEKRIVDQPVRGVVIIATSVTIMEPLHIGRQSTIRTMHFGDDRKFFLARRGGEQRDAADPAPNNPRPAKCTCRIQGNGAASGRAVIARKAVGAGLLKCATG